MREPYMWRMANISWRMCVVVKQIQSNPALVIEWQEHTCLFLLGTKPLWHWWKWKSGPTSKRYPRPRYRPPGKCPLYRYETTGQLLHSEVGSNQVGCSCTWQRSLSCETNTGATEEVPAPNQSWRGCNHLTSNWPCPGHQIPWENPIYEGRLICPEGHVSSLNKRNPIQSLISSSFCIERHSCVVVSFEGLTECKLKDNMLLNIHVYGSNEITNQKQL